MPEPVVVALNDRQWRRVLERWTAWQGGLAVARAAAAATEQLEAAYRNELEAVAELPAGASVHVDFAARTLTIAVAAD